MSARVLVVEDDRSMLTFLLEMLNAWGYEAAGATSADGALAEIERKCPQVVISDLMMPVMDGLDLLRAIRTQRKDCDISFFLITGNASVAVAVKAITEGADECLLKPFEPETLHARLESRGFYGGA